MKSHNLKLILALAGLVHAGASARLAEPVPADAVPMGPADRAAPSVTAMPALNMNRAQALSFLTGILGLGLAIGAAVEDEAKDAEGKPDEQPV